MSNSVTVIRGAVWNQRSVTCSHNGTAASSAKHAVDTAGLAPESEDNCDEDGWYHQRRRGFERRFKTVSR